MVTEGEQLIVEVGEVEMETEGKRLSVGAREEEVLREEVELRVLVRDPEPLAVGAPLPVRIMETELVEEGGGLEDTEALGEQKESGNVRPVEGQAEVQRQVVGLRRPGVGQ